VAVWKHIQKLQELGYTIEAGPKGYRLWGSPEALYPWEFPGREAQVVYLEEAPSTMDVAKDLARRGCAAFTVVVAGRQTRGRGRLKRRWHSEPGGLYFTVVLQPRIPVPLSTRVNFLASLTLARLLRTQYGVEAGLKWPNDILVAGKKLCGQLSEMETADDELTFINIGMGVNVNNTPEVFEPGAISLRSILGREVARREILSRFLDALEAGLREGRLDGVIAEWKRYSVTLGRPVRIVTFREEYRGVALDIDENGALILEQRDGSRRSVVHGDCFLQAG
jgi:BirA family biotin operon repressor/biotin-[acetyl-CoA-carboxylase] ligase